MAQTTNKHISTPKALSILVSLDGLSFCVLSFGKIVSIYQENYDAALIPTTLLEKLQSALEHHDLLKQDYDKITLTFDNELFSVVPQELFDANTLTNYLKFSTRLLPTDFADFDELHSLSSNCVYIPYTNISNYIFDTFGEHTYKHSATVFLETILQSELTDGAFVSLQHRSMLFAVILNSKLQLINRFKIETAEDFIYYTLFCYEQLGLDRETLPLYANGIKQKDDAYYQYAYKYIRDIKELETKGYEILDELEVTAQEHTLLRQALV